MSIDTKYIQVYEQELLSLDDLQFEQYHLDSLSRFNDLHGQKYFTLAHRGIRFRQYVGVLQVGDLTIEVLPKASRNTTAAIHWQRCLIEMLAKCRMIPIESISKAPLSFERSPLLSIYLDWYVSLIQELLQTGLQRNYRQDFQNSSVWKGKLNFGKQIEKNWFRPQYLYSKQELYSYESPIHRLLSEALYIVGQLSYQTARKQQIDELLHYFPKSIAREWRRGEIATIKVPNQHSPYYLVVELAKMIVLQYSPSLKAGDLPLLALLFDMNQLFEQYIGIELNKQLPDNYEMLVQTSQYFWQKRKLRPDIVVKSPVTNYVLDTKWKVLKNAAPSDQDLRQIYAYNHQFEATKGILVYPKVFDIQNNRGAYSTPIYLDGKEYQHNCEVILVDILDKDNKLNVNLVQPILEAIGIE